MLEALVALALLATALVSLLALQQGAVRQALRLEAKRAELAVDRLAMDYIGGLNPAVTPTGDYAANGVRMRWQAEPVGPARPIFGPTGVAGRFLIQRYKIVVTIDAPGRDERRLNLERVGWTALRPPF